jgi:hypothetical protein
MNSESLTRLFYNIVPSVLFIWLLDHYGILKLLNDNFSIKGNDGFTNGLLLISLVLFLGYFFQSVTKLEDGVFCLNKKAMNCVACKQKPLFDIAKEKLGINSDSQVNKSSNGYCPETSEIFHLMNNYLSGKDGSFIIEHFSSMLAFWSNNFFGLLIFILIRVFIVHAMPVEALDVLLILLFFYSHKMHKQYLLAFYDTILKTFVVMYSGAGIFATKRKRISE